MMDSKAKRLKLPFILLLLILYQSAMKFGGCSKLLTFKPSAMKWPFTLCCLLFALLLQAQWPDGGGYTSRISAEWGLEGIDLHDIQEDWNGFMWMASDEGLYRFDGTTIKHYTHSVADSILPHNQVLSILVDEEAQVLWLGTAKGLCRFDPATEQVKYYQWQAGNPNSLADDVVRHVLKDRSGTIWVACFNYGLSRYRPDSDDFENFYFELPGIEALQANDPTINASRLNSFRYIAQDSNSDELYWLASPLGPISFDHSNGQFRWLFAEQADELMLKRSATFIYPLPDQLIIGTATYSYCFEFATGQLEPLLTDSGLSYLMRVILKPDGRLWLSYRNGLATYDPQSEERGQVWRDQPSLQRYYGIRHYNDDGHIWVHSTGATLLYDPSKQVTSLSAPVQEARSPIRATKSALDGRLAALTREGRYFHLFDANTNQWESRAIKAPTDILDDILWQDLVQLDTTRWLLLDFQQAYIYHIHTNELVPFEVNTDYPHPAFTAALLDRQNQLWLATRRIGLFRIDLTSGESAHFVDELNSDHSSSLYTWISKLHEDQQGNIWVRLARSYAIYRPDHQRFEVYPHYSMGEKTFRYVRNFTESPTGEVWVASEDQGFGPADLQDGIQRKIGGLNGLLSDVSEQIDFDRGGTLWVLSDKGISSYNTASERIQNYPWDRGIPQARQFRPLPDGRLALLLPQGGLALLDPSLLELDRLLPQPYITQVRTADQLAFEGGNRTNLHELRLPAGSDYLTIEYSALGYSNPKEFAYRLRGVDNTWIAANDSRRISYSNLAPGHYTFELRSRLEGTQWSAPQQLKLYLAPYWWQTTLFKIVAVLGVLALIYAFYRRRERNIRREERLKTEFERRLNDLEMKALRAQMNPHFLFNALNSIQLFIIKNNPREAVNYLDRFAKLFRLILSNSRAKFIPLKTELETLSLYMQLEKLRFKVEFDHHITVDPAINQHEVEIPPMLLQPFIENAIWHGIQHKQERGKIILDIQRQEDMLVCTVEDDGIGRKQAAALKKGGIKSHQSMGMQITEDRLHMLYPSANGHASINIIDLYNEQEQARGTRVVIKMPVDP